MGPATTHRTAAHRHDPEHARGSYLRQRTTASQVGEKSAAAMRTEITLPSRASGRALSCERMGWLRHTATGSALSGDFPHSRGQKARSRGDGVATNGQLALDRPSRDITLTAWNHENGMLSHASTARASPAAVGCAAQNKLARRSNVDLSIWKCE
ncbi:hypothetical protein FRC08_003074 [Ceratobasidium sp. 394]|nr:hypothetical protein FRC08_003074 [Ceratobasidium sp. 394]